LLEDVKEQLYKENYTQNTRMQKPKQALKKTKKKKPNQIKPEPN
jgi:hypothetical protein